MKATTKTVKPRTGEIGIRYDNTDVKSVGGIIIQTNEDQEYDENTRWLTVWAVGDEVQDIEVGDQVLLTHFKWTEQVLLDCGTQVAFTSWKEVHAVKPGNVQ